MLIKSTEMALPTLRRCCGCLSLEVGCRVLCFTSIIMCLINILVGSYSLPWHKTREPEDNLISMSNVMFSTLSAISNIIVLIGISLRRPGYLQLSLLFNSVFILCLFLVAVVTCLFSPELRPLIQNNAGNIALVIIMLLAGAVYSLYHLTVINSLYIKMKSAYGESAIPV